MTHPERLAHYDDLYIDCSGDEFRPAGKSEFSLAPIFNFSDGEFKFDTNDVDSANEDFGSSSGFLPQ